MIETPSRTRIGLSDDGWRFRRGRVSRRWLRFNNEVGEIITLPHCWNNRDTFQYNRISYTGGAAYQCPFIVPQNDSAGSWRLVSEGFYGIAELWLDGKKFATIDPQYLGFDIPDLETGEHLLSIRLDNSRRKGVLPDSKAPDFILHGGLAGRIFLEYRPSLFFDERKINLDWHIGETARVQIRWNLTNQRTAPAGCDIEWRLVDLEGHCLGQAETTSFSVQATSSSDEMQTVITIPDARLWSPDEPNLYWAEGRILNGGETVDLIRIRFGFVDTEFRPGKGLFVNDQRLELHGCNRHEAMPGFGNALPASVHRWDAELLKQLGCNFVRLSHYPQHPLFLDACDELGIFVYSEIATWKSVSSSRSFRSSARRQIRDLILRDRHRPSSILWGMGNESRSKKAYLEMAFIAHELDPRRATTYAENHLYRARRQKSIGIPDVWGTNYELDVLEEASAASRFNNVVLSECCNHPHSVRGDDFEELVQVGVLESEWAQMKDRPYLAGYAVWCFADYATEHRQRFRRLAGLFDAWRQPKMAAELFRARHAASGCLSIFVTTAGPKAPDTPYRQDLRPADTGGGEIHIFSNCSHIHLQLDDDDIDLEGALHYVLELEDHRGIQAQGIFDGQSVEESWRAPGTAVTLRIEEDPTGPEGLTTLLVSARDSDGLIDATFNAQVKLELDGSAILHAYNESNEVEVTRGTGRVMLSTSNDHAGASIIASSPHLKNGAWDQTI